MSIFVRVLIIIGLFLGTWGGSTILAVISGNIFGWETDVTHVAGRMTFILALTLSIYIGVTI